jgi:hypothetical protein
MNVLPTVGFEDRAIDIEDYESDYHSVFLLCAEVEKGCS